ncbi:hypothetical protein ELH97_03380 [Rhizobium leguminosarum]|jgi:hypothetical protein|uniref:hypothetical protein n=1 Tax=Rhizobium leguminosarum TaxID=384 RepID=UPI00102FF6A2|nr:hypothetical protein [Rhizobium leguminosarum]TAX91040.1 hypothetical protein ELH97_03380 [Rhizobium leguminosarum]
MTSAIVAFMEKLDEYPGWREWNRGKIGYTLHFDDFLRPDNHAEEFKFDEETEKQHAVIMCYFSLFQTPAELRDLEFYFHRFPYAGTSITRYAHLSNCCELYFSKFYQYKERLKELFDAVENAVGKHNLAIGKFIKRLDKEFDAEMRERHSVHHRQRFEDIEISRLFLIENMMLNDPATTEKGWTEERRHVYRKAANAWSKRCVTQSERLNAFTEAVAEALLKVCPFLKSEISNTS